MLHQSEVKLDFSLDDAGQRLGPGIPTRLQAIPPVLTFNPYDAVYVAGLVSFPISLLIGLGCVHRDPEDVSARLQGAWALAGSMTCGPGSARSSGVFRLL